ncbi:endospore germination permease [Paenibacillus athensensis]|uniref:GerAB/ArcD/ProY family transporter n=1 Tax=Paenibacillus athensensis TaxID=1967502 RepID=UPI00142F8038|nr:endospore germination permease [Paenibacillus athensensis]MCD1259572.1 endospore germination permease [Paenibacillus athensensis]
MDDKQVINQRQLAWLTASIISSGGVLTLQNVLIRISEMDAWFSYLLPVAYIFVIAAFFAYLSMRFPGKNLFEIAQLLLGRWGGAAVSLLLLFHFWMIVVRDVANLAKFSSTLLLHATPLEVIILLPALMLMYYGQTSVEVVARVNDLFYPLFVITVLLMPLLLANEIDGRLAMPLLTAAPGNLWSSSMLALGGAGDVFILGAFLHTICNASHIRSAIRHGALLGFFLLTLLLLLVILVLGPKMPGNFFYPTYNLVQMVHITDFLDRLDIIILTIWFPTIACKIIAIYMALLIGLGSLLKKHDYTVFNKPVSLLLTITCVLSFNSTTELLSFSNFGSIFIVLAYQPLIVLLLAVAAKLRKSAATAPKAYQASEHPPSQRSSTLGRKFTYKGWLWLGNGFMAGGLLFIVVGCLLGRQMPAAGIAGGVGYALCLTMTVLTTYMEVNRLKQSQAGG